MSDPGAEKPPGENEKLRDWNGVERFGGGKVPGFSWRRRKIYETFVLPIALISNRAKSSTTCGSENFNVRCPSR